MAAPTTTDRRTVRPTSRIAVPGISRIAGMAPAPDRITVRRTGRRTVRCITARITASPA